MRIRVKVHARARRSRLAGKAGEEWKLEISAPPVDGKANKAIVEFFAEALGISRAAVTIVAGEHSQHKVLEITGISEADIARLDSST
jgi:uncharacterized protein (TIGR00251 family)